MTKSYIIAHIDTKNDTLMERYREEVPKIVAQYHGKYLVRGGKTKIVEGQNFQNRIVVIEFPDAELATQFYNSKEYSPLIKLRGQAGKNEVVIAKGI